MKLGLACRLFLVFALVFVKSSNPYPPLNSHISAMETRGNRIDYLALNDGPEDWNSSQEGPIPSSPPFDHSQSAIGTNIDCFHESFDEVLPSESASQQPASSSLSSNPRQKNEWMWKHLEIREFPSEWIEKRSQRKMDTDREICCAVTGEDGRPCNWSTTDSKRHGSTTNIRHHLKEKHGVLPPNVSIPDPASKLNLITLWGRKAKLTTQQTLEKNLLRWVISSKQPFTVIESPAFQQLLKDIPGVSLPFTSRHTLRERLLGDFNLQRVMLKNELATTCQTIALSLDVWTSKNHIPILGVIGHWLTEEFEYREKVLEFKELRGPHSGENLAAAIQALLIELNLERKLLSITGDNASNNERMAVELFNSLQKTYGADSLFCGLDSYIRCLAHIINLIVKDILQALKSGSAEEAASICNNLDKGEHSPYEFQSLGPLSKLRILALWIQRSPQRRQSWNDTCDRMNLSNKFIEYDVDTRWNSTFRMLGDALKVKNLRSIFPKF